MTPPRLIRLLAPALVLAACAFPLATAAQAKAKPKTVVGKTVPGIRGEVLKDIDDVEKKFSQLASAMSGKYQWRPGEKVRSVGEVFMHISGENYALPMILGVKPPEDFKAKDVNEAFGMANEMEKVTDEAAIQAEITKSFAHLRKGIASLRDADLNKPLKVFGTNTTQRGFLLMINNHMHEHLGQLIAYARTNGVVPPWSAAPSGG